MPTDAYSQFKGMLLLLLNNPATIPLLNPTFNNADGVLLTGKFAGRWTVNKLQHRVHVLAAQGGDVLVCMQLACLLKLTEPDVFFCTVKQKDKRERRQL